MEWVRFVSAGYAKSPLSCSDFNFCSRTFLSSSIVDMAIFIKIDTEHKIQSISVLGIHIILAE